MIFELKSNGQLTLLIFHGINYFCYCITSFMLFPLSRFGFFIFSFHRMTDKQWLSHEGHLDKNLEFATKYSWVGIIRNLIKLANK